MAIVKLLIGKSIIDALFLTIVVAIYSYSALPPSYRGWVDAADAQTVAGWAVARGMPRHQIQVQLYIDGQFVQAAVTGGKRLDVAAMYPELDENCGFTFNVPQLQAGIHTARVFAVGVAGDDPVLRQIGPSLPISVSP